MGPVTQEHLVASPKRIAFVALLITLLWAFSSLSANLDTTGSQSREIRLEARQRDASGQATESALAIDTHKTAIVVVDMWTSHYCSGATAQFRTLIPRMNQTLDAARILGIPVIFASSGDDLKRWQDKPQRLRIVNLPNHPLPESNGFRKGIAGNGPYATPCMCKVTQLKPATDEPLFQCKRTTFDPNQNPDVVVRDQDYFIAAGHYRPGIKAAINSWGEPAQQELWNFVQEKGITTLIYVGVATNMCVINREFAMIEMRRLGLNTMLVRDLTLAMTYDRYNPISKRLDPNWTPAVGTKYAVQYIEQYIGPSITADQLTSARYISAHN